MEGYEVGPFRVDSIRRRLFKGETSIPLTPKVFELLLALVERPGQLLDKDTLLHILWPDVAVEENNLTHAMAKLRKALGDDIHERRFIVTIPGQGYRFVADVHALSPTHAREGEQPRGADQAAKPRVSRLMVLPFRILRSGSDDDFLAFSVPDAITSSLAGFESIVVRSPASAARFVNDTLDLPAIARGANVDAILQGTLLDSGEEIRVSAQLVRVPEGTVLWSGTSQARRGDIFQLQDTLTRRIVDGLAVQLTARDEELLRIDVPSNGTAYELYLRANQMSYDARHLVAARDLYSQAVTGDPTYAPAWARLGRVCRVIGKYGIDDQVASLAASIEAFERALRLNPNHPVTNGLYAYLEADLGRAEQAMLRLLRQPGIANDAEGLAGLVHACRYCGLLDESVAAHDLARRLDPTIRTSVAHTYWARREFQKSLNADLDSPSYASTLAVEGMGRVAQAIVLAKESLERATVPPNARIFISGFRAAFEGDPAGARATAEYCRRMNFPDPEAHYRAAWMLARVGDHASMLPMLRYAVETGYSCPQHMEADPWFEPSRATSEFSEILALARAKQRASRTAFVEAGGDSLLGS